MNTVIGIDYGTQSARALLVDAATGTVLKSESIQYPHGILPGDLVHAQDYDQVLDHLLRAVTPDEYKSTVRGISVDATSLTLVCIDKNEITIGCLPQFANREQAQIKLWKRHEAEPWADEALKLAKERSEPFLGRTGGTISSEWALPKLLEIRDRDPEVYATIDTAFDLCEYLTFRLTGKRVRSIGSMCYKGLWAPDLGFPSTEYLDALRPGFGAEYRHLLRGEVGIPAQKMGSLHPDLCKKYGLPGNIAVATGMLDGHTSQIALGALEDGDAALVVGTSSVLSIQSKLLRDVAEITGIAQNGQTPGLCGLDTGQNCSGDMLDWFVHYGVPKEITDEAQKEGISVHNVLSRRIHAPWENKLIVADWWNGSRNTPCNLNLRGAMLGFSLNTRPEDIYLSMLQSIACGTREIMEQCASYGIIVKRILATGGITGKNPLLMQEYANLLNHTIYAGQFTEGPALGSAILAAVAAGIYENVQSAYECMGIHDYTVYTPDAEHRAQYEAIYQRSHTFRKLIAGMETPN